MLVGLDAFSALGAPSVGGALGLLSVGVWLLRLQRVAAAIRLVGLLLVLLAGVLVAGGASGVVRVDLGALRALLDAGVRALGPVFVVALAGGGA